MWVGIYDERKHESRLSELSDGHLTTDGWNVAPAWIERGFIACRIKIPVWLVFYLYSLFGIDLPRSFCGWASCPFVVFSSLLLVIQYYVPLLSPLIFDITIVDIICIYMSGIMIFNACFRFSDPDSVGFLSTLDTQLRQTNHRVQSVCQPRRGDRASTMLESPYQASMDTEKKPIPPASTRPTNILDTYSEDENGIPHLPK